MSNLGSQLSLFSLLCADFLKSLTPTSMIRHNLKNILICNRSNFKPIVNSFNTLGVSRYFWECFDSAIYRMKIICKSNIICYRKKEATKASFFWYFIIYNPLLRIFFVSKL